MEKVNIANKLTLIDKYWDPKIVGELNGQYMKLVKFHGKFDWHHHDNEDECFLAIKGEFEMLLEDKTIVIKEGEFIIIPKGIEHCPNADIEVHVLLFEPASTLNTGNVRTEKTKLKLDKI
jgi:mannose-6-phosphate isomerase-like protein (cupin superfamily)